MSPPPIRADTTEAKTKIPNIKKTVLFTPAPPFFYQFSFKKFEKATAKRNLFLPLLNERLSLFDHPYLFPKSFLGASAFLSPLIPEMNLSTDLGFLGWLDRMNFKKNLSF